MREVTYAGGISRTVWPSACSWRDQWCDEAQASMPIRQVGKAREVALPQFILLKPDE